MSLNYSRLGATGDSETVWRNIELSPTTVAHRNQLKHGIDDFASFTWRGVDAFETFGAFIINNKDSLKFYNGPTYSNSYTKPQFDSAYGQLTGVTFNIQKIDFSIGVYWISEEHYRKLIYWLNPYEVNTLAFGFEPKYYYQVKLASVEDGIRKAIGKEGDQYMYYTEMKLSFEVQGPACAYASHAYELVSYIPDPEEGQAYTEYQMLFNQNQDFNKNSDLALPIESIITFDLLSDLSLEDIQDNFKVSLEAQYGSNNPILLFDVTFKNQTYADVNSSPIVHRYLTIKYESDSALLLLDIGDSEYMLLNQLSTSQQGKRIIDNIIVNHFEIPGTFDDINFNMLQNLKFIIKVQSNVAVGPLSQWVNNAVFNVRARTNLI